MSSFGNGYYHHHHHQYYPVTVPQRNPEDSQNVDDSQADPMMPSPFVAYPQSLQFDPSRYHNAYSQDPGIFGSGMSSTSAADTTRATHANELLQTPGYSMRTPDLGAHLSNVNLSYDPWPGIGGPISTGQHADNAFLYDLSNTYQMSDSLASQQLNLSHQSPYSTFQAQTPVLNSYWNVSQYNTLPTQNQSVAQGQLQDSQPQLYSYTSVPRPLQPRAIQPRGPPTYTDRLPSQVGSEARVESSPYADIYSASGVDIMGILARVISRPDPKINIGAVDLSCAFVLCDITQEDHPIVYMSEAFGRLTDYSEEEIVGRNCRFLQSPDGNLGKETERKFVDADAVRKMRATIESRGEIQVSVINYRKGGQPFMNSVTLIPIRWDSGDYRFYVGFQVDLVEKQDAVTRGNPNGTLMINYQRQQLPNYVLPPSEVYQCRPGLAVQFNHDQVSIVLRAISASRPEFKSYLDRILVDNADDVIQVLSYDGVFLYLSPACRKVLEYDSTELVGKALSTVCHPSDIGSVTRDLRASITTAPVSVIYRIRKKQSGYTWFESHGSWHVEQGRGRTFLILVGREYSVYDLGRVLGLASDKLAENDLWMKLSTSGIILYISGKSRPVLGRTPEDMIGTSLQDSVDSENRANAVQALQTARTGQQVTFHHQIRHKKGHTMQVQTNIFPGNTKEGVKPIFLVAQVRFLKSSQPATDENEDTVLTGVAVSSIGDEKDLSITDQNSFNISLTASPNQLPQGHSRVPPVEQPSAFPELSATRGSSWQVELCELEKQNCTLFDELQRLVTRKKKRKRKQTIAPVGKACSMCQTKNTPEWRRGPSGNRDLCNSCGLRWSKQVRSTTQSDKSGSS